MANETVSSKAGEVALRKTIGKTTYLVKIHFKEQGESMEDKIKRLLRNDVTNMKSSA